MARPKTATYVEALPDYGDLMTVEDFLEAGFIDYDGHGQAVKDGLVAEYPVNRETGWPDWILPSQGIDAIPEDATHVIWFNR